MPNRTVLEALSNVERWSGFARHFGPPGRLSAQIEDQPAAACSRPLRSGVASDRPKPPDISTNRFPPNFGSHGILPTNSPVDQEKAVIATVHPSFRLLSN
jgi:hypothetical protein